MIPRTSRLLPLGLFFVLLASMPALSARQALFLDELEIATNVKFRVPWSPGETGAGDQSLESRLAHLRARASAARSDSDWMQALRIGDDLVALYPSEALVLTNVAKLRTHYAAHLFLHLNEPNAARSYAAIRRQLEWLDDHLLQPPAPDPLQTVADVLSQAGLPVVLMLDSDAETLRGLLKRRAEARLSAARATKNPTQALQLLRDAMDIWPNLPGLRDEMLKRQGKYTILLVGVRSLPKQFSPARAVHDSELQGLELLFESLLRTRSNIDGSISYVPQLAAAIPAAADLDRQFFLRKSAYWSDGARVTAADVQRTFDLLTSPKLLGRNGELANQLDSIRFGDDPFRLRVKLSTGLLDSLAPFTFNVLPRNYAGAPLASADDEAFAERPVGSGPYVPAGEVTEDGRTYVRFVVNPYYRLRGETVGLPIREIRFFAYTDALAEFSGPAPPHLLLEVPTKALGTLKSARLAQIRSLPTRRVWFLAANCRQGPLADQNLRRALAHSIDRHQILSQCFGGGRLPFRSAGVAVWGATAPALAAAVRGQGPSPHDALNGPFPAGSWACCTDPRVPAHLFDTAAAEAFLKKADIAGAIELELKYPQGDPYVELACKLISDQLTSLGARAGRPVKVRLVRLSAHQLQQDLNTRQFQLAYWRHDFPNDAYSLWPLLDPRKEAIETGANYLGFDALGELLFKAGSTRNFTEVRKATHDLHAELFERMPLIPLWQLDYHIAVSPQLQLPRLDPLRVFADIEEWKLAAK